MARKDKTEQDAIVFVTDIVKKSGSSFYWGMRFLPKAKREAMFAIYAFCRIVDDIADEPGAIAYKIHQLNHWKNEIENLYNGRVNAINKVAVALNEAINAFNLPKQEFLEIIAGMEMDLNNTGKPMSMVELMLYCRRVAGAVGMLSICVFGATDEKSKQYADVLGTALQLTNILRDQSEDADMGRLYMPLDILQKYDLQNYNPRELLKQPLNAKVREEIAEKAGKMYAKADLLLTTDNQKALKPARLMMRVYRTIFIKMQERGMDIVSPKIRLSKLEKLKAIFCD